MQFQCRYWNSFNIDKFSNWTGSIIYSQWAECPTYCCKPCIIWDGADCSATAWNNIVGRGCWWWHNKDSKKSVTHQKRLVLRTASGQLFRHHRSEDRNVLAQSQKLQFIREGNLIVLQIKTKTNSINSMEIRNQNGIESGNKRGWDYSNILLHWLGEEVALPSQNANND